MRQPKEIISQSLRRRVFSRDGERCRYCGNVTGPFQLDHVYPESKGGETTYENLAVTCQRCNNKKHAKVGIWPKPLGYFDDYAVMKRKEERRKRLAYQTIRFVMFTSAIIALIGFAMTLPELFPAINIFEVDRMHIYGALLAAIGLSVEFMASTIERKL